MSTTTATAATFATTAYTDRILALAAGLRMEASVLDAENNRHVRVFVDGPYAHSPFGVLYIGARSGKVLRGWFKNGNDGPKRRYVGATEIREALLTLAKTHR